MEKSNRSDVGVLSGIGYDSSKTVLDTLQLQEQKDS